MDTAALVLAYAAAAAVALIVTAAFSPAMTLVLSKLIPEDILPAWSQFVKFALFVAAFAGGIPNPNPGRFIDRNALDAAPAVDPNAGLDMVLRSVGGALMAASWTLLVFFAVTLGAYMADRVWDAVKRKREQDAADVKRREEEGREAKARQDASESRSTEPVRRREPAEPRPVRKESAPEKAPERR